MNRGVICVGNAIEANEPAPLYDLRISNDSSALRFLLKQVSGVKNPPSRNRLWKAVHDGNTLALLILRFCVANFANRRLNGAGTRRDFDIVNFRASNREHKCGSVSKIALESDGAGALR